MGSCAAIRILKGEIMITLSQTTPIARKEHICDWCGEKILKGEKYFKTVQVDCGNIIVIKMHKECDRANIQFCLNGGEDFEPSSFKRGSLEER